MELNRKVIKIKKDGNCFYSALSYELFGTQNEKNEVRHVVSRMVKLNKQVFAPYFIPTATTNTIDEHCQQSWKWGTWATLVDVVAAATVLSIPIYLYFVSRSKHDMKWNVIQPVNHQDLRYPDIPEITQGMLLRPQHIELLYYEDYHYDAIVAADTGEVSFDEPVLTGIKGQLVDLIED